MAERVTVPPARRRVELIEDVLEAARSWHYLRLELDAADSADRAGTLEEQLRAAQDRLALAVEELDR